MAEPSGAEQRGGTVVPSLLGPRILAGLLIAGGSFLLYHAFQIGEVRGYSPFGPSIFPIIVSTGIVLLGAILGLRTTLSPDRDLAERAGAEEAIAHWPTVGLLAALLVAYAFALAPLGYIVATAAMLPAAAWVLGSRSWARDVAVGIGLALVIYFGFTRFLQIRLPDGILSPFL